VTIGFCIATRPMTHRWTTYYSPFNQTGVIDEALVHLNERVQIRMGSQTHESPAEARATGCPAL
jgi:hypothetical protein